MYFLRAAVILLLKWVVISPLLFCVCFLFWWNYGINSVLIISHHRAKEFDKTAAKTRDLELWKKMMKEPVSIKPNECYWPFFFKNKYNYTYNRGLRKNVWCVQFEVMTSKQPIPARGVNIRWFLTPQTEETSSHCSMVHGL